MEEPQAEPLASSSRRSLRRNTQRQMDNALSTEGSILQTLSALSSTVQDQKEALASLAEIPNVMTNQTTVLEKLADKIDSLNTTLTGNHTQHLADDESELIYDETRNESENEDVIDDPLNSILGEMGLLKSADAVENTVSNNEAQNILSEILDSVLPDQEYGEDITEKVAETFLQFPQRIFPKEMYETDKIKYKAPNNCKLLGVPRVNPEIWNNPNLNQNAKSKDVRLQFILQGISRALVAQAKIVDLLFQNSLGNPETTKEIVQLSMDSARNLGASFREINNQRRANIKPFLARGASSLCSNQTKVTELLFGDELDKDVRSAKSTSAILKEPFRGKSRFSPYTRNSRKMLPQSLNVRGPPRGRGYPWKSRGQFRPQRPMNQ